MIKYNSFFLDSYPWGLWSSRLQ